MNTFDVITIGGAVRDITFYSNQGRLFNTPENLTAEKMLAFEYGAKVSAQESYFNIGGCAANVTMALSKLGLRATAIARVGNDADGQDIVARFKESRIFTGFLQIDKQLHTGVSFIVGLNKKDREHVIFVIPGAHKQLVFPAAAKKLQARWFYLTSLSNDRWSKVLDDFFAFVNGPAKNATVVWNPGARQIQAGKKALDSFLRRTNVLIVNKDEAIELVLSGVKLGRKNPNYLNRPIYLLNILREWGPHIVVITDGKRGAWAYNGKKIYRRKATRSRVIDTTGAGDAFGSAFVAGLIKTKSDIQAALHWGIVNSGSVCTEVGAQNGLLTLDQLKKLV